MEQGLHRPEVSSPVTCCPLTEAMVEGDGEGEGQGRLWVGGHAVP